MELLENEHWNEFLEDMEKKYSIVGSNDSVVDEPNEGIDAEEAARKAKIPLIESIIAKYRYTTHGLMEQQDFHALNNFLVDDCCSPIRKVLYYRDEARFLLRRDQYDIWDAELNKEMKDFKKILPRCVRRCLLRHWAVDLYKQRSEQVKEVVCREMANTVLLLEQNPDCDELKEALLQKYLKLIKKYTRTVVLAHCLEILATTNLKHRFE